MSPEEFDAFYAASVDRVTGQIYLLTGDRAEAQDAVQDAFVKAWDRRGELETTSFPEAWVRTVAYRMAVSRWRRARRAMLAYQRHGVPGEVGAPSPETVALTQALRRIPEPQRRAIVLHHLCDLPVDQVAAEVGSPVGTVKARLARGRAALAELLTDTSDGAGQEETDG